MDGFNYRTRSPRERRFVTSVGAFSALAQTLNVRASIATRKYVVTLHPDLAASFRRLQEDNTSPVCLQAKDMTWWDNSLSVDGMTIFGLELHSCMHLGIFRYAFQVPPENNFQGVLDGVVAQVIAAKMKQHSNVMHLPIPSCWSAPIAHVADLPMVIWLRPSVGNKPSKPPLHASKRRNITK